MNQAVATQQEQSPGDIMRAQVHKIEIADVLPEHITEEKFRRVAMTAINQNPALYKCERRSLLGALLNAATDGLLPDGREAALVLFGNEAVYMPMIAGVYKKVRNSGEISTLSSHVVYGNDEFSYWIDEEGPHLRHTPLLDGDRGKATGAYAVCKLKDGSVEIETMTVKQIEEVRAVSRAKGGPWSDWWDEMARKTVVRRLSKRLPMSSDQEDVLRRDDRMYDLEQPRTTADAPPRPQRVAYQPEPPAQGEDFDKRYQETMAENETESASGETNGAQDGPGEEAATEQGHGSTPAPGRETVDSTGQLPFVVAGNVILYALDGSEIGSYKAAANYFKAVKAQIGKQDDPRGFLEKNQPGANHFISQSEGLMESWVECWNAANDAQAAQDAVA